MGFVKKNLVLINMDHKITRDEYDKIIHIATEDGHIDKHEQALLRELQQMLEDKMVKFVVKK